MAWLANGGKQAFDAAKEAETMAYAAENAAQEADAAKQLTIEATANAKTETDYIKGKRPLIEQSITDAASSKTQSANAVVVSGTAKITAETVRGEFDQVIAEAGSNNPEVVQARGGEVNLNARMNKVTTALADTAKLTTDRTANYNPLLLESGVKFHSSGLTYTAFGSGVGIGGKEIHVMRSGAHHTTEPTKSWAKLVAYIRNLDGSFTTQMLPLDYSVREYRDPNVTVNKDGTTILLSAVGYDGTTYTNWMWALDANLNVLSTTELPFGNYFGWGNLLYTPKGNLIKAAYNLSGFEATPSVGSVKLFSKVGSEWKSVVIFPETTERTTETTIGFWGNKLVAVARQDLGSGLYRETTDLEGLTGWGEIIKFGYQTEAPCIATYTPPDEPLLLTFTQGTTVRNVRISATYDGKTWSRPVTLTNNKKRGGYNTFVKNEYGYSMIYFDDGNWTSDRGWTELWHKDIDVNKYIPELVYLKTDYGNTRNALINKASKLTEVLPYTHLDGVTVSGYPHHYNKILVREASLTSVFLKMKATNLCNGIVISLRSNATAASTVKVDIYKAGVLIAAGIDVPISNINSTSPKMYRFQFPATSLTLNEEYEFRVVGGCTLFYNTGYTLPFDSHDYTVTQCKVGGVTPVTVFASFGLTLHLA